MWFALWLAACSSSEELRLTYDDRSEMARAGLLLNGFSNEMCQAMWISGTGETLWERDCEPDQRIFRLKLGRDGKSIVYATNLVDQAMVPVGKIVRVPLLGGAPTVTPAPFIHHDFVETDEGFAYLSYESADTFVGATWATVAADQVIEVPEGGGEERIVWSYLDDYYYPPTWSCVHMKRDGWLPGFAEWTHTNSLVRHPTDDSYLIMPRYWDSLLKIGADGSGLQWELGGGGDEFDLPFRAQMSHPHFSHAYDNRVLVFDNGTSHDALDRDVSRVVEYELDEESRTAEVVWWYEDPRGWVTGFLGDAKRLPGGNTLIVWSSTGLITEVTPDGDIVWELKLPYQMNTGRVDVVGLELP